MSFANRAADYGRSYGSHTGSGFLHLALGFFLPASIIFVALMVGAVPHLVGAVNADDAKLAKIDAAHHSWVQGEKDDTAGNGKIVFDEPKPQRLVSALIRHPQSKTAKTAPKKPAHLGRRTS